VAGLGPIGRDHGQLSQPDPLSYEQLLKNVKSIKDLGDTTRTAPPCITTS